MTDLLDRVVLLLERERIPFALIGAAAMAAHGVSRATQDIDLLVTVPRSLEPAVWETIRGEVAHCDVRRGDDADPLLGVVRIAGTQGESVDVIVGRSAWQTRLIARAVPVQVGNRPIPVAQAADLILLKLYAGGIQDRWDIAQLLAAGEAELADTVSARLTDLPEDCASLWSELRQVQLRSPR